MASGEAEAKTNVQEQHGDDSKPSSETVFQPDKAKEHSPERTLEGLHASKLHHHDHHEHHGRNPEINADTPVDAVRAPGCFNRVKEEIEAIVENIAEKMHLKKPPS